MPQMDHPEFFDGHRVLPIKFKQESPMRLEIAHHMFFRPHEVNEPCREKPNYRTLFVSNVPPWATPFSLKRLFQSNGPIENLIFQQVPTSGPPPIQKATLLSSAPDTRVGSGFKYAYIVFEMASGVENAMKKMDVSKMRYVSIDAFPIEVGLNKWRSEYNDSIVFDVEKLSQQIEEAVKIIDAKKAEEKKKAEQEFQDADEDGWITVSRHTTRRSVGKVSSKAQAKVKAREAKKRKRKELENFYKYQMKEKKIQRLNELKEKFELDKQKVLKMKQERKFKPL